MTPSPSTSAVVRPSPRGPSPTPSPSPVVTSSPKAGASRPPGRVSTASFRVEIPEIDAVLPVVPVGVAEDGQMALPDDPSTAGWYRFGPGPKDDSGAAVISAHVDSRDEVGPLARLNRLDRGDRIVVTVDGTGVDYVVERVDQYAKTALDVDALFSRTGPARLHLVSCGGEWDPSARHYEDNVVAVARRAS
ncbi:MULTISPECIES: class F sortase [unclassified Knoellia]|uniref:class F sortase n=1 Tax=Knoellia altitudinis TaxID=3404795 RepID=UPI003607B4B3